MTTTDLPSIAVMDTDGREDCGLVQFGTTDPIDNCAELTVTNNTTGATASVLLSQLDAIALMTMLGAFIATR